MRRFKTYINPSCVVDEVLQDRFAYLSQEHGDPLALENGGSVFWPPEHLSLIDFAFNYARLKGVYLRFYYEGFPPENGRWKVSKMGSWQDRKGR